MMRNTSDPERIFRRNSRSFSLAARLLPKARRNAVARLYAFCRYLDDLADDSRDGDQHQLKRIRETIAGSLTAEEGSPESDFIDLSDRFELPRQAGLELIDALMADCGSRRIENCGELIRFAYGVAGTVGLLMRPIIGANTRLAAPFAIDLGIALQLTNIARDVAEDAARDRVYLPAEWVRPEQVERALNGHEEDTEAVDQAVRRLLSLADKYYLSARTGMAYIPEKNRRVIFLATGLYEGIGKKLRSLPPGAWKQRTILNPMEKSRLILHSLRCYRKWRKESWGNSAEPPHQNELHDALRTRAPADKAKTQ